MTLTLIYRQRFYHDNNKAGLLLVDCGSYYMNPIRLTSKKGRAGLLAWLRKHKLSVAIKLHGNEYALWTDGQLRKLYYRHPRAGSGPPRAELTDDITVGEYLEVLDKVGADTFTYYHSVYLTN